MTADTAVEIRYVGTRHLHGWTEYQWNEANIVENGFLDEFRKAQANLQANIAAGRGNTFAYTGVPGTSPLPIYLAYLNGVPAAQAADPARYTGGSWSSTNFTNPLARYNPNPYTPASDSSNNGLFGTPARRQNALNAGLAPNFFLVNPGMLDGANVRTNLNYSHYDSLQIELRKRFSRGLQFQASYAYGDTWASSFYSLRRPLVDTLDTGGEGSVRQAFKTDWVYDLPFGRGQRWGGNVNRVLDSLIGGWAFAGTARFQSGQLVDFGNVRLVGMTEDDLRDMYGVYEYRQIFTANAPLRFYRLPQDVVENTFRASSDNISATSPTGYGAQGPPTGRYLAPANGPDCIEVAPGAGDCGVRSLVIAGPMIKFSDLSAVKRVQITRRVNAEFRAEFLNAFNMPNLSGGTTGTVTPSSQRIVQLVSRINW
jgi:hypothetical protein